MKNNLNDYSKDMSLKEFLTFAHEKADAFPYTQWVNVTWAEVMIPDNWRELWNIKEKDILINSFWDNMCVCFRYQSDRDRFTDELMEILKIEQKGFGYE